MPEHAIHNPEPANFDDILKTHRECFDGARARLDEVMQEPFPLDFVSGRPDPKLIDWLEEMTARTQQAAHEADMAWRKLQVLEGVSSHLHRATGS